MITLENDHLMFRFPEVHEHAECAIDFQRTLRIPDDEKKYSLPPGLGRFPLRHLDDYARKLPEGWLSRGGVIMPMHQAEAMWMSFNQRTLMRGEGYPCAVKVATGKVCAITGEKWVNHLNVDPQDYLVLPEQPWLDGYCVERGVIRQFVAMPLGEGYSVEEQITGVAEYGGIQITAYPMKADRYEQLREQWLEEHNINLEMNMCCDSIIGIGLAPGGQMKQEIYTDPYGLDVWDQRHSSRCFVTIANSSMWTKITEERPPTEPPTAKEYTAAGLPWFDYYGGDADTLAGMERFKNFVSIAKMGKKKDETPLPENGSVEVERIISLRKPGTDQVREISC